MLKVKVICLQTCEWQRHTFRHTYYFYVHFIVPRNKFYGKIQTQQTSSWRCWM